MGPAQVSDGIKSVDLKSPNELTEEEYNSYSGAAIGGTLLMLIPVAYYDGLLFEFAKSFRSRRSWAAASAPTCRSARSASARRRASSARPWSTRSRRSKL